MAKNFYFRTEAEAVSGSANFAALISADAEAYGLAPAQAAAYQAADAELQARYAAAVAPATRTSVAVREKTEALRAVRAMGVHLARVIASTPGVTDAQLIALGLLPRPTYARRTMDAAPPVVRVMSVVGRVATIRVGAAGSDGRRKADGAVGAQVYSFVGPDGPTDRLQYHYEGLFTRGTGTVTFPNSVPSGATAWVAAAWVSTRGAQGVACAPVRVTIQGGPVLPVAA